MGRLAGQVALIAGAGRGLGKVTALMLAREEADVVVASRTGAELVVHMAAHPDVLMEEVLVPVSIAY